MNFTDKILFTQGNASTFVSGVDGRLVYNGIDGIDKKYVLEDEVPSGGVLPSSLTFGPAEIFSDSDGKFHIKFDCGSIRHDDYLDLCFYVYNDETVEARCDLSYNRLEEPEEGEPYFNTKYIFRAAYNDFGGSTYFKTENFDNGGEEPGGEEPGGDEPGDEPGDEGGDEQ